MVQNLNTLCSRVSTLVILAGKVFNCIGRFVFPEREGIVSIVDLRFGKDQPGSIGKFILCEAVDIIALDDADTFQRTEVQIIPEVVYEFTGLGVEFWLFLDEDAVHVLGK